MNSQNSSSRSRSLNRILYSSTLSVKNPLILSLKNTTLPQILPTFEALVWIFLRHYPYKLQISIMESQVMYITEAVKDSISHPCAIEIYGQQRYEIVLNSRFIEVSAFIISLKSCLLAERKARMVCQLFLAQGLGSMRRISSILSDLSSTRLKQVTRSTSIFSSSSATCPQTSYSPLESLPQRFCLQARQLVSSSFTLLEASFSCFNSVWIISTTFLPLLANSQSQQVTSFYSFFSQPMKQEESFSYSPLDYLISLANILDQSFQTSSILAKLPYSYFSNFFSSLLYRPCSLASDSWMASKNLCTFFMRDSFSLCVLLSDISTRSMLLHQIGLSRATFEPFAILGSFGGSAFGWYLVQSLTMLFSVRSQTKASVSFSSAKQCQNSFKRFKVISAALKIRLMTIS